MQIEAYFLQQWQTILKCASEEEASAYCMKMEKKKCSGTLGESKLRESDSQPKDTIQEAKRDEKS